MKIFIAILLIAGCIAVGKSIIELLCNIAAPFGCLGIASLSEGWKSRNLWLIVGGILGLVLMLTILIGIPWWVIAWVRRH